MIFIIFSQISYKIDGEFVSSPALQVKQLLITQDPLVSKEWDSILYSWE